MIWDPENWCKERKEMTMRYTDIEEKTPVLPDTLTLNPEDQSQDEPQQQPVQGQLSIQMQSQRSSFQMGMASLWKNHQQFIIFFISSLCVCLLRACISASLSYSLFLSPCNELCNSILNRPDCHLPYPLLAANDAKIPHWTYAYRNDQKRLWIASLAYTKGWRWQKLINV